MNANSDSSFRVRLDVLIDKSLAREDLNVRFLADHMYMTLSTLYRRIKEATGMGGKEYIRNKRLERAAFLLQDEMGGGSRMTICNVAYACGFANSSSFAKAFSRKYGMSPMAYRNMMSKDN